MFRRSCARRGGRHARAAGGAALLLVLSVAVAPLIDGATALGATGVPASGGLAADGVGAASAKVRQLIARIHEVDREVQQAEQRYAAALNAVASSVNAAVSADREHSQVQALLAASQRRLEAQVSSLYAAGGALPAAASLLSPSGVQAYDSGSEAVAAAVRQTETTASLRRSAAAAAGRRSVDASSHAAHSIATARTVAGAARRVSTLLTEQQALLVKARRQLASARAVAAAREAAAQALAAAQAAYASGAAGFASTTTAGVTAVGILPPSAAYLALYRHAATTCQGLSWTVLAAIGQVESGHGRNDGPSAAGAEGPMQFEPATFAAYAVDGDHDGKTDIMDPADSIYTAAHYLCANGAGRGGPALSAAILHYNHAEWYVQLVLTLSQKYAAAYQ